MVWVRVKVMAEILSMSEQVFCKKYFATAAVRRTSAGFEVLLSSFPADIQQRIHTIYSQELVQQSQASAVVDNGIKPEPTTAPITEPKIAESITVVDTVGEDAELYAEAPDSARRLADKYFLLFSKTEHLTGQACAEFIAKYWNVKYPEFKTSYSRLMAARAAYAQHGIAGILGKYGKRRGVSTVPDDLFDYFKRLYLTEGRPSENSCYMIMAGWAKKRGDDVSKLPKCGAFVRRLKSEVPEAAIYLARNGASAANRKYNFYLKRDYTDVVAGECWVSDHKQVDIAVTCTVEGRKKTVFPWLTVMRDFKSGRWVGWYLHADAPNSNHILMAFRRAAIVHGVPSSIYLDNGKDYRCNDFAGGRNIKPNIDKPRTSSMCASLGITVIYATPYNAQAKPIERDFLLYDEWFARHNIGYRGGNVVERPEGLTDKIKAEQIMTLEEIEKYTDTFVDAVTIMPLATSDWRNGKSELDIWEAEYPIAVKRGLVKAVTDKALSMFCCRTSRVMTIGRRGVHDAELGVDYYDYWMEGQKGRKVYLRRDPKAMEVAWVFDAEKDELINRAYLLPTTPALARTEVQIETLKQTMATKRRANKIIKELANPGDDIPFDEKMDNLAEYAKMMRTQSGTHAAADMPEPGLLLTNMDIDLAKQAERENEGLADLSYIRTLDWSQDDDDDEPLFGLESEAASAACRNNGPLSNAG